MRNETHFLEPDLEDEKVFDDAEPTIDDIRLSPERDNNDQEQAPAPEPRAHYEGERVYDESDADEPHVESIIFNEIHATRGGNAEDWREGEYHQTYELRDGKLWYLSGECFTDQITESGNAEWIEEHELLLDHLHEQPDKAFSRTTTDYTDEKGESHSYGIVSDGTFVQSRHFIYAEAKGGVLQEQEVDSEAAKPSSEEVITPSFNDSENAEQNILIDGTPTASVEEIESAAIEDRTEVTTSEAINDFTEAQTGRWDSEENTVVIEEPSSKAQDSSEAVAIYQQAEVKGTSEDTEDLLQTPIIELTNDSNILTESSYKEAIAQAGFQEQEQEQVVIEVSLEQQEEHAIQPELLPDSTHVTYEHNDTISVSDKREEVFNTESVFESHNDKIEETPLVSSTFENVKLDIRETSALVGEVKDSPEESVEVAASEEKTFHMEEALSIVAEGKIATRSEVLVETPDEDVQEQEEEQEQEMPVESAILGRVGESEMLERIAEEFEHSETSETSKMEPSSAVEAAGKQTNAQENLGTIQEVVRDEKEEVSAVSKGEQEALTSVLNELFAGELFQDSHDQKIETKLTQEQDGEVLPSEIKAKERVVEDIHAREMVRMGGVGVNTRTSRISRFVANDVDFGTDPRAQVVIRNGIRMERALAA